MDKEPETALDVLKIIRQAFRDGGSHLERVYALSECEKMITKMEKENG